jgi:hypothetical protein
VRTEAKGGWFLLLFPMAFFVLLPNVIYLVCFISLQERPAWRADGATMGRWRTVNRNGFLQ